MKKIQITQKQADLLGLNKLTENTVKNVVKITQQQYDRIFGNGVINENDPKGGINRVDKTFKQAFLGKNVQNLKKVSEEKFDIKKPNKSVPKLTLEQEKEIEDPIKDEVIELIKYLYRKSEKLSSFWQENGLDYDSICDTLLAKNMIVKNGGRYELAKTLGNPTSAIQEVVNTLRTHIKPKTTEPELETEDAGYPAGADIDSEAPYNKIDSSEPKIPTNPELTPIAFNNEICIFKSPTGELYVFYYYDLNKTDLIDYASVNRKFLGRDEDGQPDYEYDDDFEVNVNVISGYVNDNLNKLSKGEGLEAYESGNVDLVKLDDKLKSELSNLYDKDKNLTSILNPIDENNINMMRNSVVKAATPNNEPKFPQSNIVAKLAELKAREEARRKAEQDAIDTQIDETPEVIEEKLGAGYTHFAIYKPNNKIANGWDYKGLTNDEIKHWTKIDLKDNFPDIKIDNFKVVTRNFLIKNNLDPSDTKNWLKLEDLSIAETTAASSGAFVSPMHISPQSKKEVIPTPIVAEITAGADSIGAYDAPALANVGRNGEYKKGPKTKAQKSTQYPNGSFVEFDDCTKLNNNKTAQNSGCSQGAVDGVVKQKKTSSSIVSPSLDENAIFNKIVEKTGLTLEQVKKIIESKKDKL